MCAITVSVPTVLTAAKRPLGVAADASIVCGTTGVVVAVGRHVIIRMTRIRVASWPEKANNTESYGATALHDCPNERASANVSRYPDVSCVGAMAVE